MPTAEPALLIGTLLLAPLAGWLAGWGGRRLAGVEPARRGAAAWAPPLAVLLLALHALAMLPPAQAVPAMLLAAILVAIAVADLEAMLIPDALSLPLIPAGLALATLAPPVGFASLEALALHALAAVAGYGLIWGLAALWRRWRGVDGIGLGDAKLLAAAGAWVGPAGLPGVLLYGSVAGLVAALLWRRRASGAAGAGREIPFGPFLALGFWIVLIHGPPPL